MKTLLLIAVMVMSGAAFAGEGRWSDEPIPGWDCGPVFLHLLVAVPIISGESCSQREYCSMENMPLLQQTQIPISNSIRKMSPNRVFDNAFEVVRSDAQIKRRYGDPIKGYGRDHGGHREGRRNFIE